MSDTFKTIGLMGKHRSYHVEETVFNVIKFLMTRKLDIIIEEETAKSISRSYDLPTLSKQHLGEKCDLVIAIGGDGCLLSTARALARHNTPIVGINRGRLGFLTDILPRELNHKLAAVLDGHYREEQRFLLEANISDHDKMLSESDALNDVVLLPGDAAHMIEFDIYTDNNFVCQHRADGIIVATPTGSTAYALSGGGPILHPQLDALVLVPMFPHTLSSRPIVVNGNSQIDIFITANNDISPYVSCDGQARVPVPPGGNIHIEKKQQQLRLIHTDDHDFYETLRSKLGWVNK